MTGAALVHAPQIEAIQSPNPSRGRVLAAIAAAGRTNPLTDFPTGKKLAYRYLYLYLLSREWMRNEEKER